jgi:hypothetical protein
MSYGAWVSSTDRALTMAVGQIRLIRAVTPTNADAELASLAQAFRRGVPRLPRWRYEAPPLPPELPDALEALAAYLDTEPPLGTIYAARARELRLEAAIVEAAGTPKVTALAARRFLGTSPADGVDGRKADDLALDWTEQGPRDEALREDDAETRVRSCDTSDPRSLVLRMSAEVGKRHLSMRVAVQDGMASLAATGDGVILVAAHKWLTPRDVERTVVHEIEGHALPRARAARSPLALFAIGTARGIDDQEGRAIAIEEAAGFLDSARKYELGCRHLAARAALEGADFADVVSLLRKRHATVADAVRIAARVGRGGQGAGGLAREIVYLLARCKLTRLAAAHDGRQIEEVMRGGRIAADVALELAGVLRGSSGSELRLVELQPAAAVDETHRKKALA